MRILEPKVILLAQTTISEQGQFDLLNHIGAPEWYLHPRPSDGERLIEIAGRLCYKSFKPGLNKNVTKVREGNKEYIGNILKQKHGSVLEHSTVTFVFLDVSRIFTHELITHRAGTAKSQESMRYVRLDDIGMYYPEVFKNAPGASVIRKIWDETVATCEQAIRALECHFDLDKEGTNFEFKKRITSALRRLAPGGHTTNIMMTANHRAWRHMIELRTSAGAEEEIRKVFFQVGSQLKNNFPSIYQDMVEGRSGSDDEIHFTNSKV